MWASSVAVHVCDSSSTEGGAGNGVPARGWDPVDHGVVGMVAPRYSAAWALRLGTAGSGAPQREPVAERERGGRQRAESVSPDAAASASITRAARPRGSRRDARGHGRAASRRARRTSPEAFDDGGPPVVLLADRAGEPRLVPSASPLASLAGDRRERGAPLPGALGEQRQEEVGLGVERRVRRP